MPSSAKQGHFTFADALDGNGDERIEVINGEVFLMAPPSRIHQKICMELSRQLANFLEGKQCEIYPAPFEVRLFEQGGDCPKDVDTVVEPDISIICDKRKLDTYGCKGAPDLVMEVLSPSTQRHDQLVKLNLYQQAGVREYWIVDPENRIARVMLLTSSHTFKTHEVYRRGDIAKVSVLEGCYIELNKVFSD